MSGIAFAPGRVANVMSAPECTCVPEKIRAVHAYLRMHFPCGDLLDFHAPVRLMQAGLPPPHGGHHVVRIVDGDDYYVILTYEFQDSSPAEITRRLQAWNVAGFLHAISIAILAGSGMTALHAADTASAEAGAKR